MHGLGNDYIFIDAANERIENPSALSRSISHRNTGVGSDGIILIYPSREADLRMEMYNADGSRAQMCGNGIRCVAKYAIEHGLVKNNKITIQTDTGIKSAECVIVDSRVQKVRVAMGKPILEPTALPSTLPGDRIINHPMQIGDTLFSITCVSLGNPHAVVFVDDLDEIELNKIGPRFEHAQEFPQRINTHFVRVLDPGHVMIKSWERGSGATCACGTGACAVCVAGFITERTHRKLLVTLPGGDLDIEWSNDDHVYMTGPAIEVFSGEWFG